MYLPFVIYYILFRKTVGNLEKLLKNVLLGGNSLLFKVQHKYISVYFY